MDWQDISTAPKDGTKVNLRHELCPGYDTTGHFHDGTWLTRSFFLSGTTMCMYRTPTHWAPLPAPEEAS